MKTALLLLSILLSVRSLADDAGIQFDYMGTGHGEAELKAECLKPKGKSTAFLCQFTEVRALPLASLDEQTTLNSIAGEYRLQQMNASKKPTLKIPELSDLPRDKQRAAWAEIFIKKMKADPDQFTTLKAEECRKEPRDYYQFRGAYNETFDAFLAKTKEIGQWLCLAKDPEGFAKATLERWDLVHSTCELNYGRYQLWFYQVNGIWVHEGSPEGVPFTDCFAKMRTEMKCDDKKTCQVTRHYTPVKFPPTTPGLISQCPKDAKPVALTFSKAHPRLLPDSCKFVLDRERSSQCCAYQK